MEGWDSFGCGSSELRWDISHSSTDFAILERCCYMLVRILFHMVFLILHFYLIPRYLMFITKS